MISKTKRKFHLYIALKSQLSDGVDRFKYYYFDSNNERLDFAFSYAKNFCVLNDDVIVFTKTKNYFDFVKKNKFLLKKIN